MMRTNWRGLPALSLLALVVVGPTREVAAGVTSTWQVASYTAWDEGEAEDAFITSLGEVKPGWTSKKVALDEVGGAWAAVQAPDGTLYLGSDEAGAVWTVRGDKVTKLAAIDKVVAVVSLALGHDGTLYAGTMPAGEVWRIDTGSGKASKLAKLDGVETVWALALDAGDKNLYAGTGPDGKLFRIDPKSGSAKAIFASEDKRILALTVASDGGVWLGTSDKALVFRFDPQKNATRAMADFAGNEITAMAEQKGAMIVAANDIKEPSTTGAKTKAAVDEAESKADKGQKPKMPDKGTQPGADAAPASGATPSRQGERKGKGALYRLRGDGQMEQLDALPQTYFTSLAVSPSGQIFAGAGDKGRIYLIDTDDSVSTAFDVAQRQIAQIAIDAKGGMSFTTGDATALYRTGARARSSTYTSKVFDGAAAARFGSIEWRASGKLGLETRSGNTEEPGVGWSAWQAPRGLGHASGGVAKAKIASPPGRYVQFRAKLGSDDAVLAGVQLYYLPQNRPTKLTEVTVAATSATALKTLEAGAGDPRSPVVKVKWKVDNDDGDETQYKLAVRREGEVRWRTLPNGGKPITVLTYDWNTETYPDGEYRLRVTASDERANSQDRALETNLVSTVFVVDNQRPVIDAVSVKYPAASARATDALSVISEMAYSIDDGAWQLGATQDGLFDDASELLKMVLPDDLKPGAHTLAIRVSDESGNIGSAAVTFKVE